MAWSEAIVLYPNPASRNLHIKGISESNENITISIFQLAGTKVYEHVVSKSTDKISLHLPKLTAGTYEVRIMQGNRCTTKQLFITE